VKHCIGAAPSLLVMVLLTACGDGDVSNGAPKRLGLTDKVPHAVSRACDMAASRSSLTVACPRIVPAGGDHAIQYAGRLVGRRGPAGSHSIHLISPALRRTGSDPENPGHWALEAARSASTLRKGLIPKDQIRPWRRSLELNGINATEYRMPPYPAGGVHGGHVVFVWRGDRAAYLLSVHDPRNRRRALAMASALVADTAGG
jgi:hypothetical protein